MAGGFRAGALAERRFRLLWSAQAVSVVGDWLVPVALAFAVLELTHSPTHLGLVLFARAAPLVLFLLAGGVWADRLPRERLLVLSNLARFLTQGLLGLLLVSGTAELWQIMALAALHGTASAFFIPAATGLVPQVVSAGRLQQANALLAFNESIGQILGPALAGILVVWAGAGWAILLDSGTFLVAAVLLWRLHVPGLAPAPRRSFGRELADGWQEVRSRRWLWVTIVHFAVFQCVVMSSFVILGPLVAKESLGGAGAWALIAVGLGVGTALGNLLALRVRFRRPLLASFALLMLVAPSLVLLAEAAPAGVIAATEVLSGIALGLCTAIWDTTIQREVPQRALSRVAAYEWVGSTALRPLGLLAIGPLAAAIGIETTLLLAAGLLVAANLGALAVRSVRTLEAYETPGPLAARAAARAR